MQHGPLTPSPRAAPPPGVDPAAVAAGQDAHATRSPDAAWRALSAAAARARGLGLRITVHLDQAEREIAAIRGAISKPARGRASGGR
jgi:hypothetical protein